MENSFQTSFIPKKPVVSSSSVKTPRSLLMIILTFLLVVSVLASIGMYFYKNYLEKQRQTYSESLSVARNSFENETIEELALFNKRTELAKEILNNHLVLSPVFVLLGEITIPSIQYTSFSHQNDEGNFEVEIQGLAKDYRSIAIQANMFNSKEGHPFDNVLFYNLTKDKNGNIAFSLKFNVNPSLISYQNNISVDEISNSDIAPTEVLLNEDSQ